MFGVELRSQYRGTRIVSHFYPDQWAKVQVARYHAERYQEVL